MIDETLPNLNLHSNTEKQLFHEYETYFSESPLSVSSKLQNFTKYTRRQDLSRFLAKNEIYKSQINIPGSVVELGCFQGGGTFTFAQLSAIYEPYNHTRKIISFDTFEGFPDVSKSDQNSSRNYKKGDLKPAENMLEELMTAVTLFDKNRALSHISKLEFVKGDAMKTIPEYIKDNPHLVISLLYCDFDLFEPTKLALQLLKPRIPKGGIVAFDELNAKVFPGETLAVMETLGIDKLALKKTGFDPYISYAFIE